MVLPSLDENLEERPFSMLIRNVNFAGYFHIFAVFFLVILFSKETNSSMMIIWALSNVLYIAIRVYVFNQLKNNIKHTESKTLFFFIFVFFMCISGTFWGVATYLFMPDSSEIELFITFFSVMLIILLGNIHNLSHSLIAVSAFVLPIMFGLSLRMYELDFLILFYGLFIFYLLIGIMSYKDNQLVTHELALDSENIRLKHTAEFERAVAEQANKEKSHFLAAASHDLRQPLNSMGLFLYSLTQHVKQSEDKKIIAGLNQLDNSYQALKKLFDSLLEISQLDAGTVHPEYKNICLSSLIEPIINELSIEAEAHHLDLIYHPCHSFVEVDSIMLSRIFRNLIGNAIKYTAEGSVNVYETVSGNYVTVDIVDTGIGIPENELRNIFNEYHQLGNKRRDRRKGIGLGLSIVKKMADVLDIEIDVISILHEGSTFSLKLETAENIEIAIDKVDQDEVELSEISVLVLDDEPDILSGMKMLLEGWGCLVITAETLTVALTLIDEQSPDIILCDYRLDEEITGFDAIKSLQGQLGQTTPAIIITGDTDPILLKKIKQEGYKVLVKPIQPITLKNIMFGLLNS